MNQAPVNQQSMLADLRELVTCESFSADLDAVARSAELVAAQGTGCSARLRMRSSSTVSLIFCGDVKHPSF